MSDNDSGNQRKDVKLPSNNELLAAVRQLRERIEELEAESGASSDESGASVAIVGMGCRFPGGANDPASYWRLLREGRDAIGEVPEDRWDITKYFDADPDAAGKMYSRWGGFLQNLDIRAFDPAFFGITANEARAMDPQQRLVMECAWEAVESAGIAAESLAGTATGVFLGAATTDFQRLITAGVSNAYSNSGNALSVIAGRLSYVMSLQGPSLVVDTACSSSLVALHQACASLRSGESSLAIAGGVSVILSPIPTVGFCKAHMLAPDGRCKTFDADANGYVRGEGCGIVVLKRLDDAIRDGDRVLAVIRGSAVNQDGERGGLTVPNGPAQEAVIRRALSNADLSPADVDYVEAHGTGTSLGDPIEVGALGAVLGEGREKNRPLTIGSVKTNIGHLEPAAGIAGVIKVVLSLQNGEIPPHLHFKRANPHISLDEIPAVIPTQATPWPRNPDRPRVAGVSGFAFQGTNAHILIEEAPPESAAAGANLPPEPLVMGVSARDPGALRELARRYDAVLGERNPVDVAFTANTGRARFEHRIAALGSSAEELRRALGAFVEGRPDEGLLSGPAVESAPEVAFLFTGQGSQYAGMGTHLLRSEPIFRDAINRCAGFLKEEVQIPEIFSSPALDETRLTQPALFALEYALAQLWISWGVKPSAVLGHSVGEYAAAVIAGVMSLEDGARLIARRARLMAALPSGGAMGSIAASEDRVRQAIQPFASDISIAAINGPLSVVVSGRAERVREVLARFENEGAQVKLLPVSHAFHSPLMEPMLDEFERFASGLSYSAPSIPLISNLTGRPLEACGARYWRDHVREPVRFAEGMLALDARGVRAYVEIGPHPVLLGMGSQFIERGSWHPSLKRNQDERTRMLRSAGELFVRGIDMSWAGVTAGREARKVSLPTYPFQRARYWVPEQTEGAREEPVSGNPLVGRRVDVAGSEPVFEARYGVESYPLMADHRIYGPIVVPGAAQCARVFRVAKEVLGEGAFAIESFSFERPLVLSDSPGEDRTVQLVFNRDRQDRKSFRLFSRGANDRGSWTEHASGSLSLVPVPATRPTFAREEIIGRCKEFPIDEYRGAWSKIGFQYGEGFVWAEQVWSNGGEVLARMRASKSGGEADGYPLHPGLIDCLFQTSLAGLPEGVRRPGYAYIPLAISRFRYYGHSGNGGLWCHTRVVPAEDGESATVDLQIWSDTGALVGDVERLVIRRAPREAILRELKSAIKSEDDLYELSWKPAPRGQRVEGKPDWLIVSSGGALAEQLEQRMKSTGKRPRRVPPSELATTLAPDLEGVVHLDAAEDPAPAPQDAEGLLREQRRGYLSVLDWAKRLSADTGRAAPPRLVLVTRGTQLVGPGPVLVSHGSIWGLGRVLALEHPELRSACIDLSASADPAREARELLEELECGGAEDQVALRSEGRFIARLVRVPASKDAEQRPVTLRRDSSYLVTGGLGGLGLATAHWLASKGAGHLALVGRSEPSAEAREAIRLIEGAGCKVTVFSADVSAAAELRGVLSSIRREHGPLRGVVHAAGTLDDALVKAQDWERFARVAGPKALGAWNLDRETREDTLDFFVIYSSMAALIGNSGQANYAAANAFADSLAQDRRSRGLPAVAIQWGPWGEIGMAARLQRKIRTPGMGDISPERGFEYLGRILAASPATIGVIPADWRVLGPSLEGKPLFREILREAGSGPRDGASDVSRRLFEKLEKSPPSGRQKILIEFVRSEVAGALAMDAASIDPTKPLMALGLDSLAAVELRNQIRRVFGERVKIQPTLVFDYPTLQALGEYLSSQLYPVEEAPTPRDEAAEQVRSLSEEQANEALARELEELQERTSNGRSRKSA
jgi:acyl transferase domain-containing protein/acyl carrier protein